jgi:uroporphyrinogen decarboxylase
MTHRERLRTTLQHKEPDRVVVDFGAMESSGIVAMGYNRLKEHMGISGPTRIYDPICMTCIVEEPVLNAVGADAIALFIGPREWKEWQLPDGSPAQLPAQLQVKTLENGYMAQLGEEGRIVSLCPKDGMYFDPVYHPLADAQSTADIDAARKHLESFDWASYFDEDFWDLRQKAKKFHEETEFGIVGNLCVHVFAAGQALRGLENFMMDLALNKKLVHHLLESLVDAYLPRVEKYVEAVGEYVDIIELNDDLGSQNGPQISLEMYREMIKPYQRRLWQHVKERSGKPLLLHSCGSVYDFIPDFLEIGVDALNPIQVSAAKMDTAKLKQEFGTDLVFWGGGCDTQAILSRGTPAEVREEVRKRIDDLAPGGGFVFCQVHNIQPEVPPQNILAMYEELGTLN